MRRKDREVTDPHEIESILCKSPVCRLGINDPQSGAPYVVPLCFGHEWLSDGRLRLVFHSAREGRKLSLMRADPRVCFEMDADYELTSGVTACRCSCRFSSVIGSGRIRVIDDFDEKHAAVTLMMRCLSSGCPPIEEIALKHTVVFELIADEFAAKRH